MQETLLLMNEPLPLSGTQPVLSVVVVSFNGATLLAECLAALISQPDSQQIEIHVISKEPASTVLPASEQYPHIDWHQVAATETIPAMRSLGIMQSKSALIAMLEDDGITLAHFNVSHALAINSNKFLIEFLR